MEKAASPRSFDQMSFFEMKAYYEQELLQNQQVESELQAAHSARLSEVRAVILGSRYSGKTTLAKLFSSRLGGLYAATSDREQQRRKIREQLYQELATFLDYASENGTSLPQTTLTSATLLAAVASGKFDKNSMDIVEFTSKTSVREAILNFRASNNGIYDNFGFFCASAQRILASDYVPSEYDCIMLQEQNTAVHDFVSRLGNLSTCPNTPHNRFDSVISRVFKTDIMLTDIGSQNATSRKFLSQFDDVHCCIFVASLADYAIYSDQSNYNSKLEESFALLKTLVSSPSFATKPIALVLTKRDLFEALLKQIPFSEMFESYSGDNSAESVIQFIIQKFRQNASSRLLGPNSKPLAHTLSVSCQDEAHADQACKFIAEFTKSSHTTTPQPSPRGS